MTQTTNSAGADEAPAADHSAADLVKQVTEQASLLVRDEIKLAQLEMTRKGKQAGLGIGLFGGAGLIAVFGLGALIACAIIALALVIPAWLAALIVGVALLAVAGLAALMGKSRLGQATPVVPEETVSSVKTDVAEIKERTHR
jgi:Putative Actinobacterial Holin-X, holin superfamily III